MKRAVFCFCFLLFMAEESVCQSTHIVQRGETYELIAKRYNISLNELMDANPGDSGCFIGMKLNIPAGAVFSNRIVVTTNQEIAKLDMASKHIKNGNYRKASSLYSDILKKSPTAQAYFGRAISYYNREKFKSAIDDFRSAMHSPDCTEDMKEKCQDLISDAEKLREEQHERRNAIWGGAAALALTTVATAYVASEQNKAQTRSMYMPPSNINGFQRDTSLDYLLDPQLAIQQVQQQEYNEYVTYNRLMGTNLSFEEYENLKMRANYYNPHANDYLLDPQLAIQQVQQQEYEEYETYKKLSGMDITLEQYRMIKAASDNKGAESLDMNTTEEKGKTDFHVPKTDYSYKYKTRYSSGEQCVSCLGSGKCPTCYGKGWFFSSFRANVKVICPNCDFNHNGVCSHCHGKKVNP